MVLISMEVLLAVYFLKSLVETDDLIDLLDSLSSSSLVKVLLYCLCYNYF